MPAQVYPPLGPVYPRGSYSPSGLPSYALGGRVSGAPTGSGYTNATPFGGSSTMVPTSAMDGPGVAGPYAPDGAGATGMSPEMMAGLGLGAYALGTGMDYIGQSQGAKAMEAEASRQAAEQELFSRRRHSRVLQSIAKAHPGAGTALGQVAVNRRLQAGNAAASGAGAALGMSAPAVAQTTQTMLPQQRLGALQTAQGQLDTRLGVERQQAGMDLGRMDDGNQMRLALGDARLANAGRAGEMWRFGGKNLQMGLPLAGYAMSQQG